MLWDRTAVFQSEEISTISRGNAEKIADVILSASITISTHFATGRLVFLYNDQNVENTNVAVHFVISSTSIDFVP